MVTQRQTASRVFPTEWLAPMDGAGPFHHDPMHFPFPIAPLSMSTINPAFSGGFTVAAHEMNTPIAEVQALGCNWYHYERYVMRQPASEAEGRAMGERAEATAKQEIGRLGDRWQHEHLPAIQTLLARLQAMTAAVADAPDADVAALIAESAEIHREFWTIHFRIAIPMLLSLQIFDEFYADVFGGNEGDGHALLRGVASESVKAGHGLYDLALAAGELGLTNLFAETSSARLPEALATTDAGQELLAKLTAYLDRYGLRQDLFDLATPTWREQPAIALSAVRNYLQTGRNERADYQQSVRDAEAAIAAARQTLAGYPEAVRGQFEGLLHAARTASFLQEEHNYYIDQQGLSLLRLFFVAVGNRLAAEGVLADAADVFMLTQDELRDLFADGLLMADRAAVQALVETRRAEFTAARTLTPPPFIGEPPAGPPPGGNPMERAIGRFFGGPPQTAEHPNELKGNPGSRGTVSGPARVARTLEEATALEPGEILIAITTMPAWTPLFGIAAAVVTETGGPLSHCAIVAREYGIPAVVGAHGATRRITDGQQITVDGGRGVVTLGA